MRLRSVAALAAVGALGTVQAFAPSRRSGSGSGGVLLDHQPSATAAPKTATLRRGTAEAAAKTAPRDIPADVPPTDLKSHRGSGRLLRDAVLTNARGEAVRLGDSMGNGRSVVVFLRHMG
jgi:hypothetical protein